MVFVSFVRVFDHDFFPVFGSVWTVQVTRRRTRIGSLVGKRGCDSGDVLPDEPTGAVSLKNAAIVEGQVAAVVIQSATESGDAE